ncbi:MAG: hypothetical protein J7L94_00035 [Caldisericaceae bacterium]|nr:hypothetical protein [Caldisericaceae bacterium]
MTIEQTIQQIGLQSDERAKLELLNKIKEMLPELRLQQKDRYLISLLYDENWYIRQETAFLIDQLGTKLSGEDYYQYLFALQDFENLYLAIEEPLARRVLFEGLNDTNHRLRLKIFRYLKYEDCHTAIEKALFWYGQADYQQLAYLAQNSTEAKEIVMELLQYGLQKDHNSEYHRRQCAETLQRIEYSDKVEELLNELLGKQNQKETSKKPANRDLRPVPLEEQQPEWLLRLQNVIANLKENGIWINGQLVFPDIQIGTVTNRITYRNPGLQTWSKEVRERQIDAPPGKFLIAYDYQCIEPRLLLHFLIQNFYLSLEDIPQDDIYLAFYPEDRKTGKRLLNTLINGGHVPQEHLVSSFAKKIFIGLNDLRLERMSFARQKGYVETIAGNRLKIDPQVSNFSGKVINRLIQGSASDIFNYALCELYELTAAYNHIAQIYFVLFDEVWLAYSQQESESLQTKVFQLLNEVYKSFQLLVPLPCRDHPITRGEENNERSSA